MLVPHHRNPSLSRVLVTIDKNYKKNPGTIDFPAGNLPLRLRPKISRENGNMHATPRYAIRVGEGGRRGEVGTFIAP